MTTRSIVVIGSSMTEIQIRLDRLPDSGETVVGYGFTTRPGGKGSIQAFAAARAGGSVAFVGRVGDDFFAAQALEHFRKNGVNVEAVFKDATSMSGLTFSFLANNGENSLAAAAGANGHLSPSDLNLARGIIEKAALIVTQLETPLTTVKAAIDMAFGLGIKTLLNPSPARPLGDQLLKHLSIITPNEREAAVLTGTAVDCPAAAGVAARLLVGKGIPTAIVSLTGKGSFVAQDGFGQWVPGFKVKGLNAAGVSDVFNGALAVALVEEKPLAEAVYFAQAAAALAVGKAGQSAGPPARMDIDKFIRKHSINTTAVKES